MKIRLPILATALASTLAFAPGLSQASPYREEYVEWIYYDFIYFSPAHTVSVTSDYGASDRRASVGTDDGGFYCRDSETGDVDWKNDDCRTANLIRFNFFLESSEIVPLDSMTFDLNAFPETLGGLNVIGYFTFLSNYADDCGSYYGSISFGASNEIASYDMGYSAECNAATTVRASSTPRLLTDVIADIDNVVDRHLLEGISVYDYYYWEPSEEYFSQRPGYWRTSITRQCRIFVYMSEDYVEDVIHTPCPGDEVTPDPTAPIPLPAAGWLLLGALGTLGLARRRRG